MQGDGLEDCAEFVKPVRPTTEDREFPVEFRKRRKLEDLKHDGAADLPTKAPAALIIKFDDAGSARNENLCDVNAPIRGASNTDPGAREFCVQNIIAMPFGTHPPNHGT